jgi:hypothetical protein
MFDLEKTQVENLMTMALSPYLLFTGTAFFERKKNTVKQLQGTQIIYIPYFCCRVSSVRQYYRKYCLLIYRGNIFYYFTFFSISKKTGQNRY